MEKKKFFIPSMNYYQASSIAFDIIEHLQSQGVSIDDMITITALIQAVLCKRKERKENLPDGMALEQLCKCILKTSDKISKEDVEDIYSDSSTPQTEENHEQESSIQTD